MATGRKKKLVTIRGVDESIAEEFAADAALRGITQAEYFQSLVWLRAYIQAHAEKSKNANAATKAGYFDHIAEFCTDLEQWTESA